jgi:hypothetical protein
MEHTQETIEKAIQMSLAIVGFIGSVSEIKARISC